ncbi:MAG: biopolymer transport protein ExbD [Roseivirga sp.]|jgi:biopolymer transport protein ExbD
MSFKKERLKQEVNAGSMADIAFLLLIFFLVTTQISTDKGLTLMLPEKVLGPIAEISERNLLKIQVNSQDRIMVENEPLDNVEEIGQMVYDFVLNFGNLTDKKRGEEGISDIDVFMSLPAQMRSDIKIRLSTVDSSDSPAKAIISLKTDRGSGYDVYIAVMDQINAGYNRIYGERIGLSAQEFRKLNKNDPRERALYIQARKGINKAISLADPSDNGMK